MSDRETLDVYARRASDYADLTQQDDKINVDLVAFMEDLPEGAHLLDLGCGPGQSAAIMAARGFVATATDAVPEMVDLAARHPGVTARVATFDDLTEVAAYDGIWANFSLLHAERAEMPRHLAAIARALRPQGRFHIGVKTGEGAARDGIGRQYTYYTETELEGLLFAAGFRVVARRTGEDKGLDGVMAPWITMRAHLA